MKRNVNVFIAVVLCAALCGGIVWLQTAGDEKLGWNIHDTYGEAPAYSNGAAYTNATFAGPSASEGGVMSLSPSRLLRARSSYSYAGAYTSSFPSLQGGAGVGSFASSPLTSSAPAGGGLYTTSSQTFNSYGGGGNGGAAMGGGAMSNGRSNSGLSNPSLQGGVGSISPIAYSTARRSDMTVGAGENLVQMAVENPVVAMTNAANAGMSNGFYSGYTAMDYSGSANYGQYTGMFGGGSRMGVRGRQGTTTFDDAWTNWLLGWLQENGYTSADFNGNGIIDDDELAIIYAALQGDSNTGMGVLPTEDDIRDFLTESLPVGDIVPLLLIAFLYVVAMYLRTKLRTQVND